MRKAAEEGRDVHLALLEYCNTPISGLEYSSAQLLMSRMLKDKLPAPTSLLLPKLVQGAHNLCQPDSKGKRNTMTVVLKFCLHFKLAHLSEFNKGEHGHLLLLLLFWKNMRHPDHSKSKPKMVRSTIEIANSCVNHLSLNHIRWFRQHLRHHPVPLQKQFHLRQQPLNLRSPPQSMPQIPVRRTSGRLRSKPKWLDDYEP